MVLEELESLRRLVAEEGNDGRRLASSPGDNPVCRIWVDSGIPCVRLQWMGYATSLQVRFVHEAVIDLIRRHGLRKLLGDDTLLVALHPEEQTWIAEDWMPRAVSVGLKTIAHKRADSYFGKLAVDSVVVARPAGLNIGSFDDLEEARRWLASA